MAGRTNSMHSKITRIFGLMNELNVSPKDFLVAFLKDDSTEFATHRGNWGTEDKGWKSTIEVVHAIRDHVSKKIVGKQLWMDLILSKASIIVARQKPPLRSEHFYSTTDLHNDLLIDERAKELREKKLVEEHMPFLFQLVTHKLSKTTAAPIRSSKETPGDSEYDNDSGSEKEAEDSNEELFDGELTKLKSLKGRKTARKNRIHTASISPTEMILAAYF
ncbi:hypothetical protein PtB15_4B78 [Puccinia triticina]|nr:hypothetical protein PtB15_4B78 [Puccinia triticina]